MNRESAALPPLASDEQRQAMALVVKVAAIYGLHVQVRKAHNARMAEDILLRRTMAPSKEKA